MSGPLDECEDAFAANNWGIPMRKVVGRIVVVGVSQLVLFELVEQFSVHWRESTGETCTLALMVVSLVGCSWAILPAFAGAGSLWARLGLRAVGALALFVLVYVGDYYYSWHLRPNLGLYREPDWVAQHPGFQRELQARIATNMWRAGSQK
jgi:hypothetical protein